MTSIEERARVFSPYFNSMQTVKDRIGCSDGNLMTDYSDGMRQVNAATMEQLTAIDELSEVPDRDRFMARVALSDTVQTGGDTVRQQGILREGLAVLDRIYDVFEDGSPAVVRVEKEGVTLYQSSGVADLHMTDERRMTGALGGRERWLSVKYENGIRVTADPMLDDMIQEDKNPKPIAIFGALNGRDRLNGDDPFYQLRKWDPANPEYNPPFVRLGTPEQPKDTSKLFVTDSQRFALRAAAELMGHSDWLTTERPSEEFRDKLVREFAYSYWDLLAFGEPIDTRTQHILHMGAREK